MTYKNALGTSKSNEIEKHNKPHSEKVINFDCCRVSGNYSRIEQGNDTPFLVNVVLNKV